MPVFKELDIFHTFTFSHSPQFHINLWARMDSNHRTPERTDLQSVVVGHLTTCPNHKSLITRYQHNHVHVLNSLSITVSHLLESNLRPTDYKSVALPAELRWRSCTQI